MTKIDRPDVEDRVEVIDDEKKRALDLWNVKLVPPDGIGIFDEPTRCYRINLQWAKIVMGMVSWLAELPMWRDAENEGYEAINQILLFLEGETCMGFQLRQNPADVCILQQSLDGGETWSNAFDFSLCLAPLAAQVDVIFQQNQLDQLPLAFDPQTSTINDNYDNQELEALKFVDRETCDNTDKDAVFGACRQLVNYIATKNSDFLEQIGQDIGNAAQQAAHVLSAMPIVGLLPADELASYVAFLTNELLGEYNAIITQELLDSVMCDLFCIAVANNCELDFNDLFGYFADKFSGSVVDNFTTTLTSMVNFALAGGFIGDDYFYVMCFLQLQTVALGGTFLNVSDLETYALQGQLGQNNPSSDWTLLCTDCPVFSYWEYQWDFAWGLGDFVVVTGTLEGDGVKAITGGGTWIYDVKLNLSQQYSIENLAAMTSNDGRIGNGSDDFERYSGFPNLDYGGAESLFLAQGFILPGNDQIFCNDAVVPNNALRSIRFLGSMTAGANKTLKLKRLRIIGDNVDTGKPSLARWRTSEPTCAEF